MYINKAQFLSSLAKPDIGSVVGHIDVFARTWQCSHIRLVRVYCDANDYSREDLLAWIFSKEEAMYIQGWRKKIQRITFRQIDEGYLKNRVSSSQQEVETSEYLDPKASLPIQSQDLLEVSSIEAIDDLKLYNYGPNCVTIWQTKNCFWYLEEHLES